MKTTRIFSIANLKGGVGKTTTTVNLAAALVERGKKVLLIDNDPQGNLTSYLTSHKKSLLEGKSTCDELYLTKRLPKTPNEIQNFKDQFVISYQIGFDLIATDKNLASVEYYLYSRNEREFVLKTHLGWTQGLYDYVFIDNPPSLNLLTINALTASQGVYVPVQAEFFSLEGIVKMQETVKLVQERWNPALTIAGILPTLVDHRKKLTGEVLELLQKTFPSELLETRIRDNAKLAESSGHGKTIFKYAANSPGAEDYRQLADEVLKK